MFSVDLTFKLGGFYETVTSFRNLMLINKEGTHPMHIGPVQIQHRKLLWSYKFFLSSLKRTESSIIDLKTFGTDKESSVTSLMLLHRNFPLQLIFNASDILKKP